MKPASSSSNDSRSWAISSIYIAIVTAYVYNGKYLLTQKASIVAEMIDSWAVQIEPLSAADGGGYLARVPDLPGCISDGATPEEALANVAEAIENWVEAARAWGRPVPQPSHPVPAEH